MRRGMALLLVLSGVLVAVRFAAAQNPVLYWGSSGYHVTQVQQRL
ncbi:MAG: spore cortex-lytic enzyme, partial [Firmicutes bacterium]|nr:spore cortex-lytic enzyme [Bacillota bacterium]